MDREEIQSMIDATVSKNHLENVNRLTKITNWLTEIKERVIGIDGNGTGRIGALQRQDRKLEELVDNQELLTKNQHEMNAKLDLFIHSANSWDKTSVISVLYQGFGSILVILGLIIGYITYRDAHRPEHPIAQHITSQNSIVGEN